MKKIHFKEEVKEFKLLLSSVPAFTVVMFVLSVVAMNLLANKSIDTHTTYLALDCGIIVSWVAFLSMDMLTKHFGPKAATQLSLVAIAINLMCCLIFFVASKIPGVWGESFVNGNENNVVNDALNGTFGGTWYVLLGSTAAFAVSAVINNFLNYGIGKAFKKRPDGMLAYVLRVYVSTAVGQFVDNFVFAIIVSRIFFGWSWTQCVTCAVTGMLIELLCEAVFAQAGYFVCKKWRQRGVGKEYFAFVNERKGMAL